ncbi:heat shock protein 90 [compost metagenome]
MKHPIENFALISYLKDCDVSLYAKVFELRNAIEAWLSYVPQTFPHYTSHTVKHSDNIVAQLSLLLFEDGDFHRPTVPLSPVEVYILVVSAYLHDSGMVVSDETKIEIIGSDSWRDWVSGEGGGAKRWSEIQVLRASAQNPYNETTMFLADVQTRFLIAEFIRRNHHLRASDVIEQHQATLGRFALDNPMLQKTIADVCVSHGLSKRQLEDNERFPERRSIFGQMVNVRFLAILLRVGDLLDMNSDRACSLLLNAACPLPADSLAHWTQYQRISHFSISPDVIELTAECLSQDEHRLIQDWCQWLVDEVNNAAVVMSRSKRHERWVPPRVAIDGPQATILIRPHQKALYTPSRWVFKLDSDAVLQRLIHDVYQSRLSFVRELVQNSLDAMRCRLFSDLKSEGRLVPGFPTEVSDEIRARYTLRISLVETDIKNELSGELEKRQLLTIDDSGIGMDADVINDYFLQVGRSYYSSDDFRRSFAFIPTSRFGVGFLSVFAASSNVTVETYKPTSRTNPMPLRLTLMGPSTYLLTEKGSRNSAGTTIQIVLNEPILKGDLTKAMKDWCKRVEFPIFVSDLGIDSHIVAEDRNQFEAEFPLVTDASTRFCYRAFPINRTGIEGELYVFSVISEEGESWVLWNWAMNQYPEEHPFAHAPSPIPSITCFHGIVVASNNNWDTPIAQRLDYRSNFHSVPLSREGMVVKNRRRQTVDPAVTSRWHEILADHLNSTPFSKGPDGWFYMQRLVKYFPFSTFWWEYPATIKCFHKGRITFLSLSELIENKSILTTVGIEKNAQYLDERMLDISNQNPSHIVLSGDIINKLSKNFRGDIFKNRTIFSVSNNDNNMMVLEWGVGDEEPFVVGSKPMVLASLPGLDLIGIRIHKTLDDIYDCVIFNENNKFVEWLTRFRCVAESGEHGISVRKFYSIVDKIHDSLRYGGYNFEAIASLLAHWGTYFSQVEELIPPQISRHEFKLH